MHGASLTPQKSGDEIFFKKYGQARGEKSKKCEGGVFHRRDWSQFNSKKIGFYSEKLFNKYFTSLFLMLHGGQISDL